MIEPIPAYAPPLDDTMKVGTLSADDFRVRVPGVSNGRAVLQTIKGARFNSWSEVEVEVRDGFAIVPPDLSLMAIVHRHGRNDPKPQVAIIEGWERWRGAFATSYSHDSHNLIVYGHDAAEMALASNTVIGMKGGTAVVKDGKVAASLAYPVAGMLSLDGPEEVGRAHKRIVEIAGEICTWQPPYRTFKALSGQSLACNPGPHLTDLGLTDGTTKEIRQTLIRAL
jgi:adenine deaminase